MMMMIEQCPDTIDQLISITKHNIKDIKKYKVKQYIKSI